jgi:hypothetical protein
VAPLLALSQHGSEASRVRAVRAIRQLAMTEDAQAMMVWDGVVETLLLSLADGTSAYDREVLATLTRYAHITPDVLDKRAPMDANAAGPCWLVSGRVPSLGLLHEGCSAGSIRSENPDSNWAFPTDLNQQRIFLRTERWSAGPNSENASPMPVRVLSATMHRVPQAHSRTDEGGGYFAAAAHRAKSLLARSTSQQERDILFSVRLPTEASLRHRGTRSAVQKLRRLPMASPKLHYFSRIRWKLNPPYIAGSGPTRCEDQFGRVVRGADGPCPPGGAGSHDKALWQELEVCRLPHTRCTSLDCHTYTYQAMFVFVRALMTLDTVQSIKLRLRGLAAPAADQGRSSAPLQHRCDHGTP